MGLVAKKVSRGFADLERLATLNDEAFPEEERMPTEKLLAMADAGQMDWLALYDGAAFVGFAVVFAREACAYVFFLAIDGKARGKGYGGKALALIRALYPDCQIVLDVEPTDEVAPNGAQRAARKRFYRRNGYEETGHRLAYTGLTFEVLCLGDSFDPARFRALLASLVPVVDEIRGKKFEPVIFEAPSSS